MKTINLFFTTMMLFAAVTFVSCDKEADNPVTRSYANTGFSWIVAGEDFEVNITRGADFTIQATGAGNDLDDLNIVQTGQQLSFQYGSYKPRRLRVHLNITMPAISKINLMGAAYGRLSGFDPATRLQTVLSGSAKYTVDNSLRLLQGDISGTSKLNLAGVITELNVYTSGQGVMDAFPVMGTTLADISSSGQSKAYVSINGMLIADASGQSRIYYKGNPQQTTITESGEGKVVKQ